MKLRPSTIGVVPIVAAILGLSLSLGTEPAPVHAAPATTSASTSAATAAATPAATSGATYHAVSPHRVLDSRIGTGASQFHSRVKQTVTIATTASKVPTSAVAVTGNVTVVGQVRNGYVSVAPALVSGVQPPTSTINFPAGDTRASGVTVPLASGGKLDFMYWSSNKADTTHILFDVTGYFASGTSGATYHAVSPHRVLDSRIGTGASQFHSRVKQTVTIATTASKVPTSAVAVTGNVTVVGQVRNGYVSVAPALVSGVQPPTSTINFPAGDTRASGVTVPLASGGKLDFMYWSSNKADTTHILFDVTGYFASGTSGATYHAVSPHRVLDSRIGTGASQFHSRVKQTVTIATTASKVPTSAVAVTGNVTVVGQVRNGYVSVAPSLVSGVQPPTSTINFPAGDTRASGVTVPLASGGKLDFMYWSSNKADTTHILFDVTGYFAGGSVTPPPPPTTVPNFSHVYVIIFENKEYSSVVGSSKAPYINSLIAKYGSATNFTAERHPSEPNYIALTSGGTQGITDDGVYNLGVNNLFDQVAASGRTWHAYMQGYPGKCSTASSSGAVTDGVGKSGAYVRKHNPAISYTSISGNAAKCAHITNLASFDPAAANFEFITPNMINDMHDGSVADGDNFLKAFLPKITSSSAFANSVVFVTFDEGSSSVNGGGHIMTLAITPGMTAGYKSTAAYNHYSMLRTIEDAWGLSHLGNAASAADMAFPY